MSKITALSKPFSSSVLGRNKCETPKPQYEKNPLEKWATNSIF